MPVSIFWAMSMMTDFYLKKSEGLVVILRGRKRTRERGG